MIYVVQISSTPEPVTSLIDRMLTGSAQETASMVWLDRLEEQIELAGQRFQEIVGGAERLMAMARETETADLDEPIGILEDLEERLGADLRSLRSDQERWATLLWRNPPAIQHRFSSLIRHHEENLVRAAEAIRDVRWRLLGLQARTDDEGDAPAFDDPDALERYLGTR